MSLRYLKGGFVLTTVLVLTASGCLSPPWRKTQMVSQHEKDAYLEQAATRIQYDTSPGQSHEFQPQLGSESVYSPVASTRSAIGAGSCCH